MLSTLRIKNLALVADLTLELRPGFSAITGETGAGKSVILGALNLVLGKRADRGSIRTGADSCTVEAVFDLGPLRLPLGKFLEENGLEPCDDGQLVLKRAFTASGTNRQFINGSPTTLAILESLGGWLLDMHGPHDHQSLLQTTKQLAILDAYGGLEPKRESYAALVREYAGLAGKKASLIIDDKTYAQQLDLLRHQTREIGDARLQPGEDVEVESEHRRVSNAARLIELAQAALAALGENEDAVLNSLGAAGRPLQDLVRIDEAARPMLEHHSQAAGVLRDLQGELSRYADRVDLDPERLAALEQRLDLIQSLKRKYGPSLEEVIAFGEDARNQLASLESRDDELEKLNAEMARLKKEVAKAGDILTAERRKLLPRLGKAVGTELGALGFRQSRFEVSLISERPEDGFSPTGFDRVEFQFAPNPGEPLKPLRAIASSGELARVMLALKTVLADQDSVPVLVFDEVDANVGGETAHAVGEKMARIAKKHQVLCITHLAPVAAYAANHYVVAKEVKGGRTESRIELLEKAERVEELARMLGGGTAATRHAEDLLK